MSILNVEHLTHGFGDRADKSCHRLFLSQFKGLYVSECVAYDSTQ